MGYERKRGKLADLNRCLRGGGAECFSAYRGRPDGAAEHQICHHARHRYAIAARRRPPLVGTMAHPLNRPVSTPTAA